MFGVAGGQSTLINISIDESPPASVCRRGQLPATHHSIMCDVPTGAEPLTGSACAHSMFKADAFTIKILQRNSFVAFSCTANRQDPLCSQL